HSRRVLRRSGRRRYRVRATWDRWDEAGPDRSRGPSSRRRRGKGGSSSPVALSQRLYQQAYLISSLRSGCRLLQRDQVLAQRADNSLGRAARTAVVSWVRDVILPQVITSRFHVSEVPPVAAFRIRSPPSPLPFQKPAFEQTRRGASRDSIAPTHRSSIFPDL